MTERRRPVSLAELSLPYLEPNVTAILPGKCQARCPFCVEPEGPAPRSSGEWVRSFESLLRELPAIFTTLSISGGEPSLSPVFEPVLDSLARHRESGRLKRVVLTTNGCVKSVFRHLDAIGRAVTNVNLSRHAIEDRANAGVFRTQKVPTQSKLADLISQLNRRGVPVNLNCVYSAQHAFAADITGRSRAHVRAEAKRYITFAKSVGASSVVFRYDHREWDVERPTALETAFDDYAVVHHTACASCRVVGKLIRGLPVNFKRSAYEPVQLHDESELYELVLHSDGVLYRDWSRLHPVERPLPEVEFVGPSQDMLRSRSGSSRALVDSDCEPALANCRLLGAVPWGG